MAGDCLLDVDLVGSVNRLCQDAPVPVLDLEQERARAAGAGLAARLATADGVAVTLITCLAGDRDGKLLRTRLAGLTAVIGTSAASTPVRTRLLAGGRTIGRVDRGGCGGPPVVSEEMLDALVTADAVLVSDHGRGLAENGQLRGVLGWLARRVPVVWDPHPGGAEPVAGATIATPSLAEASAVTGLRGEAITVASALRTRWQAGAVAITMGAHGALVYDGSRPRALPAKRVAVEDARGAGDRFAAAVATRLLRGDRVVEATSAAVDSATRFLADGGVAALSDRATPVVIERIRGTA